MEAWLKCWFGSLPPPPLGGNIREVWLKRTFTHTAENRAVTSSARNFVCYGTGSRLRWSLGSPLSSLVQRTQRTNLGFVSELVPLNPSENLTNHADAASSERRLVLQ